MADGKYNQLHLPTNLYKSGHEAGQAQMRTKAQQAFRKILEENGWITDDAQKRAIEEEFRELLK
ncbi:MAG: hypothetical protein IJ816_02120 [Alloprevotella sp.]|nr:hypothetical protein [Alloprevotella sp.]